MANGSKAWRCLVCGYVHYGETGPDECPVCGATRSEFEAHVEPAAAPAAAPATKQWRCLICLYMHEGDAPPEECPVCGAAASRFEPVAKPTNGQKAAGIEHVVVLGAGIAGISAVEAIRKTSPATRITLVSRENDPPYYRLNLTRYLAGEIDEAALPIHPASWYEANGVELLCGAEASDVQLDERAVVLGNGKSLTYDKLILTAGAHPFVPPIPGGQREGVRTVRSWQDARWILEHLRAGMKCVCIGGGVLGVETAGALAKRGADVTLLEGFSWLMPRQLNQAAGRRLAAHLEQIGVRLRAEAKVKEIVGDERVGGVLLEDGETLPADLVVITTGVRTNSFLARRAGLHVGSGVVVDDHLVTSHPDVLAAGDVAEHRGVVYGLWSPAQYMGSIAGMNAAGAATEFAGIPRSNTLKVLGVDLLSIGQFEPQDGSYQAIEREAADGYMRFVFRDGRMVGAILLGDTSIAAQVSKAVAEGTDLSGLLARRPTAKDMFAHLQG
jgi:nitrite reductase (NADH) large subunit